MTTNESTSGQRPDPCRRCGGTGRYRSALKRRGRNVWAKCDCTYDEFGRLRIG